MKLDEAVEFTGLYKPQQVMAVGHAPSAAKRDAFQYLSSRYLQRMIRDFPRGHSHWLSWAINM